MAAFPILQNDRSKIAAVIAAGVAVRLLMLLLVVPSQDGDGVYYLQVAATGPDLYRPPLYGLFLSVFGVPLVFAAQSALMIAVSALACRWTGSIWVGLLIACCPFLIVNEFALRSEAISIPLVILGWLCLDRKSYLLAGFALGLAILAHDIFLLLPAFAVGVGWWLGRVKGYAIMAVAAYATILPWMTYNLHTHDRFALSQGRAGFNLWVGTWERHPGWLLPNIMNGNYPPYAFRNERERADLMIALRQGNDEPFKRAAIDRITTDPLGTAKAWVGRYWRLWIGTRTDQNQLRLETGSLPWLGLKTSMWGLNLLLLIGGIWSVLSTRRWVWSIPALYLGLLLIPFHNTETRFSLPGLAVLLIPLGLALPALSRSIVERLRLRRPA